MLLLMALFFATRINKDIPDYRSQSYLEGDLALIITLYVLIPPISTG